MKITVTGASGLLGSSVARTLVAQGHSVTTLQRRPSGVDGARDVLGTVTDPAAVAEAVNGAEAVVHLAAKVSLTGDPDEFEEVNVGGTRTLVYGAQAAGVSRLVHISSPSVAHTGESIVGEGARPASPDLARGEYARTKAAGEIIALGADSERFRVLVLRPHLMWGPGDVQLTERIVERARSGRMPVLGAGTALVDTLFVDNAVEAIVAALDAVDTVHGEALVVTNGQPRPIGELMSRIAIAGGAREPRLRIPVRAALAAGSVVERVWELGEHDDEPPLTRFLAEQLSTAHWFDQRRTQEVLGWRPRVTIEEGLELLAAHYAQEPGLGVAPQ
ncbi:nucleoside-diphosphate-sugar epimerase [Brevibacterium sanguinis]|uniref:Nucleoside-diphosphate-sugar epimerase n=2 Tax=Brevibacterium TaxID=1696 RepID=A0A366INJ1_9MICO|nr:MULTISPECIES: NAD-dependent epimerase/dehydratase family protein [Brevibacterium]RBP67029.1 nucleoside-diphosphate-sugar epimerase [Brevibacterium sanguinis]RBP73554.1 nucleoside-diphosphate-sugar epimerase [Brevibacterium celere]